MLAISAARSTPCASNSAAQRPASPVGSSGGNSHPSVAATAAASCPVSTTSASKKRREKKCVCASVTAQSLQGVCIRLVPVGDARRQRQLRQARHVVHPELLHHGLAVTADGLQPQVEQHRDVLAGLPLGH